jgi:uncharacterized protein YndB with AHSA1/START domain
MTQAISHITEPSDCEMQFDRILNAPRELVFEVWTNPEHVAKWFGPNGITITVSEMSVSPGGIWRYIMHAPDGSQYPTIVTYKEVVKPERLTFSMADDMEVALQSFNVVVTFDELDGKTKLGMRMIFPSKEIRDKVIREAGAVEGNKQTMDKLEAYLTTLQ